MTKIKKDTRLDNLMAELRRAIEFYQKKEDAFIEQFKNNPVYALDWSKSIFEHSTTKREYSNILLALQNGADLENIITKKTHEVVLNSQWLANKSTSQTANLIKECEIQAIGKFLELVKYY